MMNRFPLLEDLLRDTRLALRQLRKSPLFTLTAVLTLALGIGTATAMFVVVYGVLLQPLPFPNAQQLYQPIGLDPEEKGEEYISFHYNAIKQWQEATGKSEQIAFSAETQKMLDTPSGAQQVGNVESSINLLSTLGAQPLLGRNFLPEEVEEGKSHVVLLNYSLWNQAFSADRDILGKTVPLDGVPYTVIGVMPLHFRFPLYETHAEVWTPLERNRLLSASASNPYDSYDPIIRVAPGASPLSVQDELSRVQARTAQMAKPGDETTSIRLKSLRESLVGNLRPALTALEIAVVLVWFISCCNVAGLLLARIAARHTEIAVRRALGAGRLRIVRQFLTESLLLSSAGALAGLGLAMVTLRSFRHMLQHALPLSATLDLNWHILTALAGLSLCTAFAFGVLPAAIAAHSRPGEVLKSGSHSTRSDRSHTRMRNLLLVSEVAVSITLLVAAGLMMRTVRSLQRAPLGFRTDHIVLTNLTIPGYLYKDSDVAVAAWQPLLERVQHLPGVRSAALSTVLPIGHSIEWLTLVYQTAWTKGNVSAEVRAASPDLLQVLGVRLRTGRFLTAQDSKESMPVAVVNQTFVKQYLGGHDALGQQIRFGRVPGNATIVGVLEDIHQDAIATPTRAEFYLSMAQLKRSSPLYLPMMGRSMQLAVRTRNSPEAMIPELGRVIRQENPHVVIGDVTTMDQTVEDSIGTQRLAAGVIGTFGALALLITVVGLYGLLTYAVTQRTREIGIRMALGADRRQVMRMILWKALLLMGLGIAIGVGLSFWTNRFLQSFLYGVSKNDPRILVFGPAILLLSGIFAALIPARRAASVDPMQALRTE
jgi:predicted permease